MPGPRRKVDLGTAIGEACNKARIAVEQASERALHLFCLGRIARPPSAHSKGADAIASVWRRPSDWPALIAGSDDAEDAA